MTKVIKSLKKELGRYGVITETKRKNCRRYEYDDDNYVDVYDKNIDIVVNGISIFSEELYAQTFTDKLAKRITKQFTKPSEKNYFKLLAMLNDISLRGYDIDLLYGDDISFIARTSGGIVCYINNDLQERKFTLKKLYKAIDKLEAPTL